MGQKFVLAENSENLFLPNLQNLTAKNINQKSLHWFGPGIGLHEKSAKLKEIEEVPLKKKCHRRR